MTLIPADPISPREFMEDLIPSLFAEVELDPSEEELELKLGVVLAGDDGGDWTLHFVEGELGIGARREEACEITVIQAVEDWRAALWEGRPALVAAGVDRIREGGAEALRPPAPPDGSPRPDPLKGISDLRGRIEMVIEGEAQPDWSIGILIGGGPIPETPQATIRLGSAQADAIRAGDLHPLEALITGQLQLDGDLGLILQLQAVAMTLSMTTGGGDSR